MVAPRRQDEMENDVIRVIHECCCGLDIHKKMIMACLLRRQADGQLKKETRTFSTMTEGLVSLLDWLKSAGCSHAAMESTGVYWKPIYNVLEGEMEVLLVNAQHIKAVPGRKTDVKDAEWIASLLQHGLLSASFVPPRPQRELRELTRTRKRLIEERSRIANRIQKVLEDTNIKLSSVVTDITGKTARLILDAMLAGEQNPQRLAGLARGKLRKKQEELAKAVKGTLRENHRFLLNQHLAHLDFLDKQIKAFDLQIAHCLGIESEPNSSQAQQDHVLAQEKQPTQSAPQGEPAASPQAGANLEQPQECGKRSQPICLEDYRRAIEHLDAVTGINLRVAEVVVAEIGLQMERFPTAEHLASWVGLCPGNAVSAGKRLSGKTTKGNRWLRTALIEAAHGASKSKGTFLGAYYRRLCKRIGKKKAIVALAHRILIIIYHILRDGEPFRELGEQHSTEKEQETSKRRAIHRLEQLGYQVQLQQAECA
jgi:transposase